VFSARGKRRLVSSCTGRAAATLTRRCAAPQGRFDRCRPDMELLHEVRPILAPQATARPGRFSATRWSQGRALARGPLASRTIEPVHRFPTTARAHPRSRARCPLWRGHATWSAFQDSEMRRVLVSAAEAGRACSCARRRSRARWSWPAATAACRPRWCSTRAWATSTLSGAPGCPAVPRHRRRVRPRGRQGFARGRSPCVSSPGGVSAAGPAWLGRSLRADLRREGASRGRCAGWPATW